MSFVVVSIVAVGTAAIKWTIQVPILRHDSDQLRQVLKSKSLVASPAGLQQRWCDSGIAVGFEALQDDLQAAQRGAPAGKVFKVR